MWTYYIHIQSKTETARLLLNLKSAYLDGQAGQEDTETSPVLGLQWPTSMGLNSTLHVTFTQKIIFLMCTWHVLHIYGVYICVEA